MMVLQVFGCCRGGGVRFGGGGFMQREKNLKPFTKGTQYDGGRELPASQ